jgi:uncharacterized protein
VIWHAGEPLIPGHRWYHESFIKIASIVKDNFTVEHRIQTNATLISDEWCNVFRNFNVQIGISLDGPESVHNAHRKNRQGHGTHGSVMNGLTRLKENGIDYGIICVITPESVNRPDEMFEFFTELGVNRIAFNCQEIKGSKTYSSMSQQAKNYRSFLARFWKLTKLSGREWFIRDIDQMIDALLVGFNGSNMLLNRAGGIISVTYDGKVSTFSPELLDSGHGRYHDFTLGNIHDTSLLDILKSPKAIQMSDEISQGIKKCRSECEYFAVCGGGDPSSKIFENGTFCSSETLFCQYTVKIPTDLILQELDDGCDLAASKLF